ncbi:hypothetical protein ACWDKQ_30045 [Saccharopolyspora sp. NPDC000995]
MISVDRPGLRASDAAPDARFATGPTTSTNSPLGQGSTSGIDGLSVVGYPVVGYPAVG